MEVQLTPAQQARLADIAHRQGTSVSDLLASTAQHVIEVDIYRSESLKRAIEQADRGELIDEEEMDRRFESMLARS